MIHLGYSRNVYEQSKLKENKSIIRSFITEIVNATTRKHDPVCFYASPRSRKMQLAVSGKSIGHKTKAKSNM